MYETRLDIPADVDFDAARAWARKAIADTTGTDLSLVAYFDHERRQGGPIDACGGEPPECARNYAESHGAEYRVTAPNRFEFFFVRVPADATQQPREDRMDPKATETKTRFVDYLNTCNQAIDRHEDEFPFKQLVSIGERVFGDKTIGVGIYKTDPNSPHDYYTIQVKDGRLHYHGHGKHDPDIEWKVKEEYLDDVVSNPETYIEHPFKLDWEWLK